MHLSANNWYLNIQIVSYLNKIHIVFQVFHLVALYININYSS